MCLFILKLSLFKELSSTDNITKNIFQRTKLQKDLNYLSKGTPPNAKRPCLNESKVSLTNNPEVTCSTFRCQRFPGQYTCTAWQRQFEKAPLKPQPTITQHSADISPALVTRLIPPNADTCKRLFLEAGRRVTVKLKCASSGNTVWQIRCWWSSSCLGHYFWWSQMIGRDRTLLTQTLQLMDEIGENLTIPEKLQIWSTFWV